MASFVLLAGSLIASGLWLWMARANRAGRSWARIVATVFFGVLTASGLALLIKYSTAPNSNFDAPAWYSIAFFMLYWLVGLFATVLLWRRPSSDYYAAVRYLARPEPARRTRD